MRYEDASHTAFQGNGPVARDDSDALPAGTRGPATGNLISGEGTQTGLAGADQAAGAHITAIAGKGGEDSNFAAGKLSVNGEFGKLSVDADGNYSYMANAGTPENSRDRFSYTLADGQGGSDSALLLIEIGKTPAVIKANAQQIVPGPDGVVTLPPGVSLADVHVVGRNLVIDMPDGTQLVIVDGAVFVPQLVLDGVEVPATNLAALLIGQEPQPAAGSGPPQSSGGNFDVPVPPLDPGVPLGDLIPPTEYEYTPPDVEEIGQILDRDPEAGAASAQLDDDAQADGNPGGVGDDPGTDVANGSLPGSGGDGSLTWGLLADGDLPAGFSFAAQPNGDVWIMQGLNHVLTVSVDPSNGDYTVTQVAPIDHPAGGAENNLDFVINYTVTDDDGDVAVGSLTVNVDDDTPVAVPEPEQVTGLVDEDDLSSGNHDSADGDDDPGNADGDNDGTTTSGAAGSLSGLFSFGADQPGSLGLGTDTSGMTAQGLSSNGIALTYAVVGDTLTASAGGETIFTLTVNADGSWSFDLEGQLDHEVSGTEDNLDIDFSSMIVGTDHDGDTASLPDDTFVVTVDDDLPVPAGEREQVTGLVDEDDLPDGNHDNADGDDDPGDADGDNDGTTTGGSAGSLSSLFSFGADQPGTVTLSTDTSGLPVLHSNGALVSYAVVGDTLTASANGETVFTLTVNPDGSWVFDLEGQLDHSIAGTEDNLDLDFSSIIVGVDADGDTATLPPESFVVDVDDDMPQEFEDCPDDVITVNEPGTVINGDLNLPPVGADDPGVVSFGLSDGDPVLDNADNPVTANGQALFYFINDAGVLEARVGDATGDVIFTITLNGDGTYTYEQVGSLGEGGQIDFEDLTSASAGNVEFRGVGADDPATTVDLLLSAGPADGSTVNTDSDSIGSANQSMDNGETVRIDLVSNLTTGAGTPSGFGYGAHVSSNSFVQVIPQVQGSQSETVAFTVWALNTSNTQANETDRDPAGGFSDSTITSVAEVTVKDFLTGESTTVDVTGFTVGVFTPVAYGISARVNADGSVTFSGVQQGDSYGINTGVGEFNAVVVQADPTGTGGSSEDSFDLGIFSIGVANEFDPVDLSIPIVLTDADGDPVVCDIDIHIGAPLEVDDIVVTVNEAGLPIIGSDAASNSETQGGDLQGQVSGGTGPYTFAFANGENGAGAYGTLILNADGTFSYTLATPFDSQPDADDGTNPELGAESFQVVATDSLGATQTLTVTVNIIDDVPTAVDDTDSIASGQYGPATGNVITDASLGDQGDGDNGADTKGADGGSVVGVAAGDTNADLDNPATVGVVIQGAYGKLTLNSDGSYSYARDPGTDGGVQDIFTYTIEDGDGDRSNATLTITIADAPVSIDGPDEGEGGTVVDEKGLPVRTGEPEGSGEHAAAGVNGDTSEITNGTINFSAPDGPAIVRIDGVVVTGAIGQEFVGDHGTLKITSYNAGTGQIGYSYTLADNTSGEGTFDDFALQVEDQDGDIANDTLVIDIIDDNPAANDDSDTVDNVSDQAVGNVITGDGTNEGTDNADYPGADDFDSISGLVSDETGDSDTDATGGFDVTGQYGTLHMNADGSYTYTRDPGSPGAVNESFTYTYLDGDGDEAEAVLTISIADDVPTLPNEPQVNLDDDVIPGLNGNPDGTGDDDPDTVGDNDFSGQLVGVGGDGDLDYYFSASQSGLPAGFTVDPASTATHMIILQSGNPVLTIDLNNETGDYTVTQTAAISHPAGLNENNIPNIVVSFYAQDVDGSQSAPGTMTINVDDDTPTINVTQTGETGVVLTTQDAETDGVPTAEDTAVSAINFGGVFGLTSSAGADGGSAQPLSFDLNVTAQNSGLLSHGQVINLFEVNGVIFGTTAGIAPADANTPGVVFSLAVSGTGVVTLTQYQQVDHAVEGVTTSPFDDQFATLVDGKITLTASSSITDGDGDTATDQEVVDLGGNIRFADDGPDAVNDSANQTTENQPVTTGNVLTNDAPGADGVNTATGVTIVAGSLTGAGGLVYNGDGTFTYTPAAGEQGSIQFQYKITDYDGDTDTATVTINLQPDSTPSAVDSVAKVDDDGLTNGLPGNGTGDLDANSGEAAVINPSEAIWHGQLSATSGNDTITNYNFASMDGDGGTVGTENVVYSWNNGTSTLTATIDGGARDGLELFHVVINQATGSYNLTLVRPVAHVDEIADQENDATTNLTFTVTDSDGDTDDGTIAVTFDDDMPQAIQPDAATLENEAGATVTADLDDDSEVITDFGADGAGKVRFANIANGDDSGLTSSDDPIEYWLSNDGQTLQARTNSTNGSDGELIFTVQINQATGDYTVTMSGTIDNGAGVSFDDLTSSAAGNVDYRGVGADDPATAVDLILSGSISGGTTDGVNTDSDSIGVANQSMDVGELLRIDFVSNLQTSAVAAGTPMGFTYGDHVETNSYIQTIPQVQGNQAQTVSFKVWALNSTDTQANEPDRDPTGGTFNNSTKVNIVEVTVIDYLTGDTHTENIAALADGATEVLAFGMSVTRNADGSVTFSGVQEGDQYGINTGGNDFNAVVVQDTVGSFDLGVFAIGQVDTGEPIDLSFDVSITDADGDTVTVPGAIDVTFEPATEGAGFAATSFMAGDEQMQKSAANSNTITMAAAVAAAGMTESAAAAPTDQSAKTSVESLDSSSQSVSGDQVSVDSSDGGSSVASFAEAQTVEDGSAKQSGHGRHTADVEHGKVDDGSSQKAANDHQSDQAANDHGPAAGAEPQVAVAPDVAMVSAEAMKSVSAEAKGHPTGEHGTAVEQVVAEALGHGNAPTVEDLLATLPTAGAPALHDLASPAFDNAPAWDMGATGSFANASDMLIKAGADMAHHDAVQPAVNG